mmetsp:Transcript_24785/g.81050  ORF Transcript_24785/g.81050 Transcript_24785/m.81050 type:complete len:237 (-) Transcript_24785:36-746(-)
MAPTQDCGAPADADAHRSRASAPEVRGIPRENLHPRELGRVRASAGLKNGTAVQVRHSDRVERILTFLLPLLLPCLFHDLRRAVRNGGGDRAALAVVLKPGRDAPASAAWEEGELALAEHLKDVVAPLEIYIRACVIRPGAETDVGAAVANKSSDASVPFAIESRFVREVRPAREDNRQRRSLPSSAHSLFRTHGANLYGGVELVFEARESRREAAFARALTTVHPHILCGAKNCQ